MLYRSRTHLDRLCEHETRVDSLKKPGDETEDSTVRRIVLDHPTPLASDSSSSSLSTDSSSYRYHNEEEDTTDDNACIRNSSSMSSTHSIPIRIPQHPSVAIRRRTISSSASSHHDDGESNYAVYCEERKRYDSSTWNMYYRIHAHRRKQEHEASVARTETIPSMVLLNANVSATQTSHVRCNDDPKYPSSPVCVQSNNDLGYYDEQDTNKTNDGNDESEMGIFDLEL